MIFFRIGIEIARLIKYEMYIDIHCYVYLNTDFLLFTVKHLHFANEFFFIMEIFKDNGFIVNYFENTLFWEI